MRISTMAGGKGSVILGLLCMFTLSSSKVHKGVSECMYYDHPKCESDGGNNCVPRIERCTEMTVDDSSFDEPGNTMQCYGSFYLNLTDPDTLQPWKKGCWMNDDQCNEKAECVAESIEKTVKFCCCDGELCNQEIYYKPVEPPPSSPSSPVPGEVLRDSSHTLTNTILYSIVPIIGLGLLVVSLYTMWRHHQSHSRGHTQLPTIDPSLGGPTPSHSSLNLTLLELKARGRYGSIWKAQMPNQQGHVAVKIFPLQDKHSWRAELDIYSLPHMKHDNILSFIASDKREESLSTELWLITQFHEQGSLCDYLKGNSITWAQLCRIAETMTCGLAYLHDEIPATPGSLAKPAIAHRDFKSKNVLLKADLTAVIADFGLALMFEPGKAFSETHTQVGTRRYMAPEVLEGAICFNRDSFLRIDMYACGLIVWELMARCSYNGGPVEDYRLPFEAEVGLQPTLEEMQTLVVTRKVRPSFAEAWYKLQGLSGLMSTVDECWDQDAEARLSAGCVQERVAQMARTVNSADQSLPDIADTDGLSTLPAPIDRSLQAPPYFDHVEVPPNHNGVPPDYDSALNNHNEIPPNYEGIPPNHVGIPSNCNRVPFNHSLVAQTLPTTTMPMPPSQQQHSDFMGQAPPSFTPTSVVIVPRSSDIVHHSGSDSILVPPNMNSC